LLTDVVFAILPIVFIRKIQRPLREKIVLYFLMALGITCAASIIPKLVVLRDFESRENFTQTSAATMLWSQVEVFTGIIAVCIPVLKSSAERALKTIGLLSSSGFGSEVTPYVPSVRTQYTGQVVRGRSAHDVSGSWQPVPEDWSWIGLRDAEVCVEKGRRQLGVVRSSTSASPCQY
jgi:hypothetical protein